LFWVKTLLLQLFDKTILVVAAFVVRFLTRRFIGDYDPKCQKTYCISTALNGDQINLELLDAGGHYLEVLKLYIMAYILITWLCGLCDFFL